MIIPRSQRRRCFDHALTNSSLSRTPRPTRFTLPNLAKASATLSNTRFSAALIPSASSEPSSVSLLLVLSSDINCPGLVVLLVAGE